MDVCYTSQLYFLIYYFLWSIHLLNFIDLSIDAKSSLLNSFALFNATGWEEFYHIPSNELLNTWVNKRNIVPPLVIQIRLTEFTNLSTINDRNHFIVEFLVHPPSLSFTTVDTISNLLPGDIGFLEVSCSVLIHIVYSLSNKLCSENHCIHIIINRMIILYSKRRRQTILL